MSKKHNDAKVEFYLSFFDKDEYYEKEINGFWLIKQWDGNLRKWTVHLYSKESYENYKGGQAKFFEKSENEMMFEYKMNKED